MNNFAYILSESFDVIDVYRKGSEREIEWLSIIEKSKTSYDLNEKEGFYTLSATEIVDTLNDSLLAYLQDHTPNSEETGWQGRFKEEEVFTSKVIFDKNYKLFTSGIDNIIDFLSNIYDAITKENPSQHIHILFGEDFKDLKHRLRRIKSVSN